MSWKKKIMSLLLAGSIAAASISPALAVEVEKDDIFGYQDWYDVLPEGAASGYVPVSKTEYEVSYNNSAVQKEQDTYSTDATGKLLKYVSISYYSNGYQRTDDEITYTYDSNGRLSSMQRNYSNSYDIGQITYDANGNIIQESFQQYNSLSSPVSTYTYSYKYDNRQNVIERTEQNGRRIEVTTYAYDAAGNLIRVSEQDEEKTYEYDASNRVTRKTSREYDERYSDVITYEYDGQGRLVREIDISGDDHEIEQITYEYDNQGRLISKTDTDGDSYTYEYDAAGNLVKENNYDDRRLEEYTVYTYKKIGDTANPGTNPGTANPQPSEPSQPSQPSQPSNPAGGYVGQFTDVPSTEWYANAVQYVYSAGLMSGTSATTFEPNTALSRAMVAQILYTHAGQPKLSDLSSYSDVKSDKWYAKAIAWAKQANAVSGYQDGTFQPDKYVARQELAQMLYADAGRPNVSGSLNFSDASKAWATDALLWATQKGIISGMTENGAAVLNPQGNATRAQAAAMIMQYVNKS